MMSLVLYLDNIKLLVIHWREEIRGYDATRAFATQQSKDKKLTIEVVAVTYRSEQQYNIRRGYTTYINHIRYQ